MALFELNCRHDRIPRLRRNGKYAQRVWKERMQLDCLQSSSLYGLITRKLEKICTGRPSPGKYRRLFPLGAPIGPLGGELG